jgi:hypothetical protein
MEKKNNYGADMVGGLGTLSQGMSSVSKDGTEPLVSLTNKFSSIHDVSMKEAMRMAKGNNKND